jgi:predicted nucleotidyltransferase component of viral defense system
MTLQNINITPGHIARHTPRNAGAQGREAAIIDIAQDLMLRHLYEKGALNNLAFKGGTALRKFYAGKSGRFSLDLDFSIINIGINEDEALTDFITSIEGLKIGPFRYGLIERRGKWSITYEYDFINEITLKSKLDVSSPPWLLPTLQGWNPMPIHSQYGLPILPQLQIVRLEENIAEKIARLNRLTPARDMYDLVWLSSTANVWGKLDKNLIKRLAVLKIWTDANGVRVGSTIWKSANETYSFDPLHWLRDRSKGHFDEEDIGALAVPTPSVKELSDAISVNYAFLENLDDDECILACIKEKDRSVALKALAELPDHRLAGIGLY